ncbi:PEGA domain-containing protein [Candidatus Uhrbacteria bacterium]|nr:PEGA domain-containing protein [Candidatus Uhrbacteria bacterium]
MTRRSIPLYRQILPWIYVLFFLLTAPILLLYSSGYRYNWIKQQIERNSTLIVDSIPKNAEIFLDHAPSGEKSPITLQNISPGWHTIRVQKEGYFSWEKNLELQPERVTFATGIWLWKKSEPSLLIDQSIAQLALANTQDALALLHVSATSSQFNWWRPDQELASAIDVTTTGRELPEPFGILPPGDPQQRFVIRMITTTHAQILMDRNFLRKEFALPPGPWKLWQIKDNFVLLQHGEEWLALDPSQSGKSYITQVSGDHPRWLDRAPRPTAIFLKKNEVWLWTLGQDPELLWRQSEPLTQAIWHDSGTTIFLATTQDIFALSLDERNGRVITPLAHFDQIHDLAMLNKILYIAGAKDGQDGLWKLEVE